MRLAELMGIFSITADTGMGMPQDHGLRSASLAARIASNWSNADAGTPGRQVSCGAGSLVGGK